MNWGFPLVGRRDELELPLGRGRDELGKGVGVGWAIGVGRV